MSAADFGYPQHSLRVSEAEQRTECAVVCMPAVLQWERVEQAGRVALCLVLLVTWK